MEALKFKENIIPAKSYFSEEYVNGFDKKLLHLESWIPVCNPRAVILIIHSIGDHINRYKHLAQYFSDYGIAVIGMDMHGHGKSQGKKGKSKYQHLFLDVKRLTDIANLRYPNLPKIVYGHGMGGNLALTYATMNNSNLMAIISSSPWIRIVNNYSTFFMSVFKIIMWIYPSFTVKNRFSNSDLNNDFENGNGNKKDPLLHRFISARLLSSVYKSGEYILHNKHKVNMPLLLMHGSNDRIASWHATADFAKYTSPYTSLKIWKGALHELHNEYEKDEIFEFVLHWIEQLPGIY